jgi:hypothetical protein
VLRASIVLNIDDPPVANLERLHPRAAPACPVRPREGDDDAVAVLLDRVEAIVMVAGACGRGDGGRENLTGLVRAASGGRGPPKTDQPTPAAPLHRRVDQRDERLDVALSERLERGTDGIDADAARLLSARPPSKRRGRASRRDGSLTLDLDSVVLGSFAASPYATAFDD